jgi:hypothetical protein
MGIASTDAHDKGLYKIGGVAALLSVLLIPVQVFIFVRWPPPVTVTDWFNLFQENWFLGLLSLDLLYLLNNTFLVAIYLGLFAALKHVNRTWMTIMLALGFIGIAAYFASNTAFEMLELSRQYAAAGTEAERVTLVAAGRTLLTLYKGTAFDIYYVYNAAALLIIAVIMLRSHVFSKATAYWGLASGILMTIPSTAGTIGMVFALASLIPWMVFCVLLARRLFQLMRPASLPPLPEYLSHAL